jgi:hypothetical protein
MAAAWSDFPLAENLSITATDYQQLDLQVESNGLERLHREHNAEEQDKSGRGQRQPMINELAVAMETSHKLTRVYHQNTDADQDRGQSNAECDDQ